MSNLPSSTLTVLHTDIENSTPLALHLREQYPAVLATHRTLLRAAFSAYEGREVDTQGDSFFVVFPRATQAVAAAVQIQRALATEPWPQGGAVRVRIGMHTGEPIRTTEGYTGLDVIRAARIMGAGHGGQVLLSASTAAIVQDALLDEMGLRDLGAHRLKGLLRPERIFQLIIPGLPVDFPPLQTLDSRTGPRSGSESERVLTTVLFTDIAGATERLFALGDRRWRELREQYKALVRRELARYGGHEVDSVADGFFATFDSPANAIRCACAIRDAVKALGIEVRVGVHAGEVEHEGEEVTGITVNTGSRVTGMADPGEVLVSSTVKDLVAGSGIAFTARGTHTLKGLPGEWSLFAPDVREASSPAP
ncbi:MAG: adenylate/guanylate cyclase domain-containing protein [Candidatus Entotheonellia bacterium]